MEKILEFDTTKDHSLAWDLISFSFCESGKKVESEGGIISVNLYILVFW